MILKAECSLPKKVLTEPFQVLLNNIKNYKAHLTSYSEFADIWFKEDNADEHAFKKMHVRLKNEIVHGNLEDVSIEHGGKRLSPEELLNFYEQGKDFVIVDARNWYESKIGNLKMPSFRL
jgi:UPF0176 protein